MVSAWNIDLTKPTMVTVQTVLNSFFKMSSYRVYRWFIIQILEFNSMFKESVCNFNHLDISYFPCAFPHISVLKGRVLGGVRVLFHRSREYKQVYFLFCFVLFHASKLLKEKKKMSWENPGNFNSTGNPRSLSLNIFFFFSFPLNQDYF